MKKLISVNSSSPVQQLPAKAKKTKRVKRNANPEQNRPYGTSPGRRSSIYRGVTKHRWTGRFEAHLWDKTCWNSVQNKKGRQVYLGAYDEEEAAAHTYDLAALKYWGPETVLNFPLSSYTKECEEMQSVSKEEYLASLRRRSSGFSRGVSKYRGVARHHHNGRWEARIGRIFGNKYLYLGTYSTQEEAAQAYDLAAIEYRGLNAVTNFDLSHYVIYPQQQQHKQQQHQEQTCTFQESLEVLPPPVILPPPENTDSGNQISGFINGEQSLWSLCMESGYTTLPDSCMVLEKTSEMQDLFNHFSFEDNIDSIFESVEGIDEMNGLNIEGLFGEGGIISLDQIDEPGLIEEPASSMNSISCPCSSPCPSPAISS